MKSVFCILLFSVSALQALASPIRDLEAELRIEKPAWKVFIEKDSTMTWVTENGLIITLTINPGIRPDFPKPSDLAALRNSYRKEALSYGGGLVEAEPRDLSGITFNLVTMKFPMGVFQTPRDDRPGFGYQINAVIPTSHASYVIQVAALEKGTTGVREAAGIIIFMQQQGITDLADAAKAFRRDPYDHQYDEQALFNVCDERRFDASFPDHPLSICRAQMDVILNQIIITDRIRSIATFRTQRAPNHKK